MAISKKEAALWYVRHGFTPMPACWPDASGRCACPFNHQNPKQIGKAPLLGAGYQNLNVTEQMVDEWWTKWPHANICIMLKQSRLVVLDIDSREAFKEAQEMLGDGVFPIVSSGRGKHVWFTNHLDVTYRSTKRGKAEALDILASGYVIAPPSIHRTGRKYEWAIALESWPEPGTQAQLQPPPQYVQDVLLEAKTKRDAAAAYRVEVGEVPTVDLVQLGLPDQLVRSIVDGSGRECFPSQSEFQFSIINKLISHGLSDEQIISVLLSVGTDRPYAVSRKFLERRDGLEYAMRELANARATFKKGKGVGNHLQLVTDNTKKKKKRLPEIITTNVAERDIRAQAWRAVHMANDPPFLFQQDGNLVEIVAKDDGHTPKIKPLNEQEFRAILGDVADWVKIQAKKDEIVRLPARVPDVAYKVMHSRVDPGVPRIKGLVYSPVYNACGELIAKRGYNPESRLYFQPPDQLEVPGVPDKPTKKDVAAALDLLLGDLFVDFPFRDDASKANALGALLTLFCRELVDGLVPLQLVDAPAAGTGKTFLVKAIHMVATGLPPAMDSLPRKEEEVSKNILAILLKGNPVVVLDNATGRIESETFNRALTSETFAGRILKESRTAEIENRATWFMTGNNVDVEGDIARRTVWIRLDAKQSNPFLRGQYKHTDLMEWIRKNRGMLVWACLVLVQNWLAKGRTPGEKHMASFERWARTISGILAAAGVDGFLDNQAELIEQSMDGSREWENFLASVYKKYQGDGVFLGDLFKLAVDQDHLYHILGDGGENAQKQRLARALKEQVDAVNGQYVLRCVVNKKRRCKEYRVEYWG
jgi:hypothetical protein